jgi:hypothetical protein
MYDLNCALPFEALLSLLKLFEDKDVLLLWKTGFVLRDTMCDIFMHFTDTEGLFNSKSLVVKPCYFCFDTIQVKLKARMLNAIDQLSSHGKPTQAQSYMNFVFMEYYLALEYVMLAYNVPFHVSFGIRTFRLRRRFYHFILKILPLDSKQFKLENNWTVAIDIDEAENEVNLLSKWLK